MNLAWPEGIAQPPAYGPESDGIMIFVQARYNTSTNTTRLAYVGNVVNFLTDPEPPAIQTIDHLAKPEGWVGGGTYSARVRATDPGLGLAEIGIQGHRRTHTNLGCSGSPNYDPCPTDATRQIDYSIDQWPEGIHQTRADAKDVIAKDTLSNQPWDIKIDRTPPELQLSGELWDQRSMSGSHLTVDAGQDLYGLNIEATDGVPGGTADQRRSGVQDVAVFIDGVEEERIASDPACVDSCPMTVDDFVLDSDWLTEGEHVISVVARDRAGHVTESGFTVRVVRDDYYAQQLDQWRQRTEQDVDETVPVIGLTAPMPAPPDDWRRGDECEASSPALRACYDAVTEWGTDVQEWLGANLPAGTGASDLEDPPTFDYSYGEDTTRDLTRRTRDMFVLAKRSVAEPTAALDVAIGFHEPWTRPSSLWRCLGSTFLRIEVRSLGSTDLRPRRRGLARTGAGSPDEHLDRECGGLLCQTVRHDLRDHRRDRAGRAHRFGGG